jgi:hypothetical protein
MAGYTYDKSFAGVSNIIAFTAALGILSGIQEDLVCILGRRAQFWSKEVVCSRCTEGEGEEGSCESWVLERGPESVAAQLTLQYGVAMFLIKLHNR